MYFSQKQFENNNKIVIANPRYKHENWKTIVNYAEEIAQSRADTSDQWQLLIELVVKMPKTMRRPINQYWFLKADSLAPSESPDSVCNVCKIIVQNIISFIA